MRRPTAQATASTVVDLGARRRARHLGDLRALLDGIDALWSSLWRAYPGREREVVELHLRFDALHDRVVAWALGGDLAAGSLLDGIATQLEAAAILGAPTRGAEGWRSLCRQLESLEGRVAALELFAPSNAATRELLVQR